MYIKAGRQEQTMIITICAVCLLARMKNYKLKHVFNSWTFYPVLITQFILIFFQLSVFFGTYYFVQFAGVLERAIIISFFFSIFAYQLYKPAIIGSVSIVFGTILNEFVIAQNGGRMPVFPSLSYLTGYVTPEAFGTADTLHILGSEATKFKFLTDYIDVGYSILSVGDVLIHLFTFLMLYATIRASNIRYGSIQETSQKC